MYCHSISQLKVVLTDRRYSIARVFRCMLAAIAALPAIVVQVADAKIMTHGA